MSRDFSISCQSKLRSCNLKIHPARLQIWENLRGRWSSGKWKFSVVKMRTWNSNEAMRISPSPVLFFFFSFYFYWWSHLHQRVYWECFCVTLRRRWLWDKQGHGGNRPRSCLIVLEALICRGSAGNQVGLFSAALCLPAAQFHVWAKTTSSPIRKMSWW